MVGKLRNFQDCHNSTDTVFGILKIRKFPILIAPNREALDTTDFCCTKNEVFH